VNLNIEINEQKETKKAQWTKRRRRRRRFGNTPAYQKKK